MALGNLLIPGAWSHNLWMLPLALIVYCVVWIIYAMFFHPLRHIPGPWLASVSRIWIIIHTARGDMEFTQRALHKKYGPLIRVAPDETASSDPEAIKQIYRTQGPLAKSDFYTPWTEDSMTSKYPDHFGVTDEKLHAERRRIVSHVYSLSNVLQSEEYFDKCSDILIQKLTLFAQSQEVIDLGTWLQWYQSCFLG
jgi:hypothetical protein